VNWRVATPKRAVDYYIREAGPEVALAFVEALRTAYRMIADHPAAGSPRPAHELALPGLRSRMLKRYPISSSILSRAITSMSGAYCTPNRDIPAWLREPEGLVLS